MTKAASGSCPSPDFLSFLQCKNGMKLQELYPCPSTANEAVLKCCYIFVLFHHVITQGHAEDITLIHNSVCNIVYLPMTEIRMDSKLNCVRHTLYNKLLCNVLCICKTQSRILLNFCGQQLALSHASKPPFAIEKYNIEYSLLWDKVYFLKLLVVVSSYMKDTILELDLQRIMNILTIINIC